MKFEKQMKKHIDETLEANVPNPYPVKKKPAFPNWLKIAAPIGTGVLAVSLACAIIVPVALNNTQHKGGYSSINKGGDHLPQWAFNPTVVAPKQLGMQTMDGNLVKRTATKAIENLEYCFEDKSHPNMVV